MNAEFDDVAKVSMRRPVFFGRPFLGLAHEALRGESVWSVGEREFFGAVVSRANQCSFCVGTHGEIARTVLGVSFDDDWHDGRFGPKATAVGWLLDSMARDPESMPSVDLTTVRLAEVTDEALRDAFYVAFVFNTINRVADALDFRYRTDRDRRRGARILALNGYKLPGILLTGKPEADLR